MKLKLGTFLNTCQAGRLGAIVGEHATPASIAQAQLDMVERRILRIEMALRRAGIEVEAIELPL